MRASCTSKDAVERNPADAHSLARAVIVKASSGPRYVVGCRSAVPKHKLKNGIRVSLDMTTLTIMRCVALRVPPSCLLGSQAGLGELTWVLRDWQHLADRGRPARVQHDDGGRVGNELRRGRWAWGPDSRVARGALVHPKPGD